jgi:hypothetical protein
MAGAAKAVFISSTVPAPVGYAFLCGFLLRISQIGLNGYVLKA